MMMVEVDLLNTFESLKLRNTSFFLYYVLPDNDGNDDDNNGKVSSPIRKFNLTVYLNE